MKMKSKLFGLSAKSALYLLAICSALFTSCYEKEEIDADKYWSNLLHLTRKKYNLLASERESFKKTNKVKVYLAYKGYEFDLMNDAIEIVKSED